MNVFVLDQDPIKALPFNSVTNYSGMLLKHLLRTYQIKVWLSFLLLWNQTLNVCSHKTL